MDKNKAQLLTLKTKLNLNIWDNQEGGSVSHGNITSSLKIISIFSPVTSDEVCIRNKDPVMVGFDHPHTKWVNPT